MSVFATLETFRVRTVVTRMEVSTTEVLKFSTMVFVALKSHHINTVHATSFLPLQCLHGALYSNLVLIFLQSIQAAGK